MLSARSHLSKLHVYCVGIPSHGLVCLAWELLSCLLQEAFHDYPRVEPVLLTRPTWHLLLLWPGPDPLQPYPATLQSLQADYSRALGGGDPAQVLRARQLQASNLGPLPSHKKGLFLVSNTYTRRLTGVGWAVGLAGWGTWPQSH